MSIIRRIPNANAIEYIYRYELVEVLKPEIIKDMELLCFDKGELICSKDSELEYMFFLVEGKAKTYTLHDNGKSILLCFNQPLSIYGDVEFLTDYKVACNVEAIVESILLGINMEKIRRYAFNDPVFLRFIIKNLSDKLYRISNSSSINLLYPLESRIASYLLSMTGSEENVFKGNEVNIPKLTEIAPLLGTSYRHLNRVVNKLVKQSIIKKYKSTIIILNIEKLKDLSQGNIYER